MDESMMTGTRLMIALFNKCAVLKSQVVLLQTAHSWANEEFCCVGACIGSGVAFETIKLSG